MKVDLTGKTFGHFLVIGVAEVSRNGHHKYHVKCSCGVEKTVFGTHLIQGNTTHCGCSRRKPRNWKGSGTVSATYFASLKRGAYGGKGRKPIEFDISIDYLANLLDNVQEGRCALTGLKISVKDKTASVDRIDSSLGYTESNVQWLHKDINMMKRHYSTEYFTYLCSLVAGACEIVDLT
jgi:hypothetical protein